ncbi:hypothetical protein L226DRAFT_522578 [Lentinus tigrinus ALCF2SS1-7]|uniref:Uncharacterized protein n=1 Tax=Lentinus tigrinus ALCF2SS1-6 TaxID=1328759 RepID=A0A5C2RPT1_9APHY|nr:hypothetical protein L227DRAFT_406042 [Lentinus tigrinus ALCF2SS1-6]RPD75363.1 hypothetical protein L226DRAFT_522578 [Lentinus tigrinus ALCF2SS1-7]
MAGEDILPANTHLIGLWLQLLFTGAYLVYFPKCVVILRRKVREGLSIWLPLVCGLFFALTVTGLVVEMHRGYQAFSVHPPELPNPSRFFADASSTGSLIKNGINVVQAIISDMVIVYRTFIVWNCSYLVIILPVLVFLADAGMGIWSVITLSQTKSGSTLILAAVSVRVRYFFVLTFCLNMLCACLICFRIWRSGYKVRYGYSDSPLSRVMAVVVESAGFYCAYLFVIIVTNSVGSNVFFIFLDPTPPVVAIVYTMLIVRAHTERENISTPLPSTLQFSRTRASSMHPGIQTSSIGVEINLERVVHTDLGSPRTYVHSDHPYARSEDNKEDHGQAL